MRQPKKAIQQENEKVQNTINELNNLLSISEETIKELTIENNGLEEEGYELNRQNKFYKQLSRDLMNDQVIKLSESPLNDNLYAKLALDQAHDKIVLQSSNIALKEEVIKLKNELSTLKNRDIRIPISKDTLNERIEHSKKEHREDVEVYKKYLS
jgi:hypothetical protein